MSRKSCVHKEFCPDAFTVASEMCNGAKQTNADRIRSMTDEELAEWLCDIAGWLPMYEGKMHPILDWLKQEAID